MVISQLDQTRTSVLLSSLSMLDTWKSQKSRSWRPIFGLNAISRTSRECKTRCVALHLVIQ